MSLRSPSPTRSLSEGEVSSGDEEKAISTKHAHSRNSGVNTSTRLPSNGSSSRHSQARGGRDRSRSPYARDRDRSRSPYRANKPTSGEKRRREDDHYTKHGSDLRRFKVHYEDKDSRPRARSGRDRDRSRSPYRETGKSVDARSRPHDIPDRNENGRLSTASKLARESIPQAPSSKDDAKIAMSLPQQQAQQPTVSEESHEPAAADQPEEPQPKLSEAELIEQRRKRREAIKNRHKSQPPLLVQALEQNMESAPATPAHESNGAVSEQQSPQTAHSPPSSANSPATPHRDSPPQSPAAFAVMDDEELANRNQDDSTIQEEGPSAADYDPNMDMQEDRPEHKRLDVEVSVPDAAEKEPAPKQSKEYDMFADDDDDDMFAPDDAPAKPAASTKQGKTLDQSLLDNWDYPDGHYRIILGELLDGRYAVQQQVGKGTFATVVKAQDTETGNPVAIKIAANNETMYKAGQKEMDFLQILNDGDPEDKKHIIRLLRHFDHKGHMCIVFEALSADLREVLKKFGRNVGLNLKAIRSYAQQMFLALSHMKRCNILHADLKPDNILVSERRSLLKFCDLGTAAFADDAEVTPYLVSRFYRAPEVILGMPFDYAIDMWSIGCTLFELYTGRILFAGADNNQMLRAIQECRGKLPIRMLKKSSLADRHFDFDGNFFSQERDKITGKTLMKPMNFNKLAPGKDLRSRLAGNANGLSPAELKEHASFVDLLDKCLQLDPARRVSPNDALRHGFVAHGGAGLQPKDDKKPKVVPAMTMAPNVSMRGR
ncbi:kinase-like protein [Hortaea werneckii]|nr:kinase-like protein [Hortaea werneckii]KAI7314583.1 kinase-like protein [Hortaea werneckii]